MSLIITLVTVLAIYVISFKDDYEEENMKKVTGYVAILLILLLVILILACLGA